MARELQEEAVQKLDKFSSPWALVKKAFSSLMLVALIGLGLLVNWVLAIVFAIGWFSVTSWLWLIIGVLLFLAVFPIAYFFCAYWYGQALLFWEAYREVIRPFTAKIFSAVLDKSLKEKPLDEEGELKESKIVKELEERSKHLVERLPDFIRAYFQLFITSKDVANIIKKQRQAGSEKAAVKKKAMDSMFEALDLQMAELMEPSLIPFGVVLVTNIATVYFLMFY